ncbi:MAG: hypothetical protein AAFX06_08090 [Planctomycetota bacterium]
MQRSNFSDLADSVAFRVCGVLLLTACWMSAATGAEPALFGSRIADQLLETETEYGITLSGMGAFQRMEKAARLRPVYQAMINAEQDRIAVRRQISADPSSSRRVEMATYRDRDAKGDEVVTLLRRKRIAVDEKPTADLVPASEPFEPLVVASPPPRMLSGNESKSAVQTTPGSPRPERIRTNRYLEDVTVESAVADRNTEPLPKANPSNALAPGLVPAPLTVAGAQTRETDTPAVSSREDAETTDPSPRNGGASNGITLKATLASGRLQESSASSTDQLSVEDEVDTVSGEQTAEPVLPPAIVDSRRPALNSPAATKVATTVVEETLPANPRASNTSRHDPGTLPAAPNALIESPAESLVSTPPPAIAPPRTADQTEVTDATTRADAVEVIEKASGGRAEGTPEARVAQWPFQSGKNASPTEAEPANNLVTLNVDEVDVRTVFELLHKGYGLNILVAPDVTGTVTANVSGLSPEQALRSVVKMCNLAIQTDGDVTLVYPAESLPRDARQLRVFPLDFARSEVVEATVQGILSPVGNAYVSAVDELDNRKARESIVVIDIPEVLEQVDYYIAQIDQAPRQVLIEARVLEIELRDNNEHGINFEQFFGRDLQVGALNLGDSLSTSTNPFFFANISGSELDAALTLLETTTDAKTLATPQVMVVNGQNAKMQVGQQLGFAVATVTQTATIQDVRFLDTGIVLDVTPTIARDGRILMQVKPKVSSGAINPDTLLPEESTRQVETSVMLNNHQGMIIGGLIQEDDRVVIRKLPWVGDFKLVGPLFQRRESVRTRSEIIVALVPHIIEGEGFPSCRDPQLEQDRFDRTEERLFNGPLNRNCRPSEPRLPDVKRETPIYQDMRRQRNDVPYCKGCEPIKSTVLPIQ